MLLKRLLPIVLLMGSHAAFAEHEFITTYTDVETVGEAQKRLGRADVNEADLLRVHYVVEKNIHTQKVIIRPLKPNDEAHASL